MIKDAQRRLKRLWEPQKEKNKNSHKKKRKTFLIGPNFKPEKERKREKDRERIFLLFSSSPFSPFSSFSFFLSFFFFFRKKKEFFLIQKYAFKIYKKDFLSEQKKWLCESTAFFRFE